jgi:hypothetical protein
MWKNRKRKRKEDKLSVRTVVKSQEISGDRRPALNQKKRRRTQTKEIHVMSICTEEKKIGEE